MIENNYKGKSLHSEHKMSSVVLSLLPKIVLNTGWITQMVKRFTHKLDYVMKTFSWDIFKKMNHFNLSKVII